jgi:hypothetical protein
MSVAPEFQNFEILCLEHENTRLYAEVIQVVVKRQLCWVRPLVLLELPSELSFLQQSIHFETEPIEAEQPVLYDLRQGADLLYPLSLFRTALDVEVIPVLAQLNALKAQMEESGREIQPEAHTKLQEFARRLWQAHPEEFHS